MSGMHWQRRWDPLRELQQEMGRILSNLEPLNWRVPRPFPAVNLYDGGEQFVLYAGLPGATADEIELTISGDTVTLRGDRKRPEAIADECYRRQERPFGRWARTITLPERVNGAEVTASFAHGLLKVTIPKSEESRPRHISVSTTG